MKNSKIKILSRASLLDNYKTPVTALLCTASISVILGCATAGLKLLLQSGSVKPLLVSVWERLPAITGIAGSLFLLAAALMSLSPFKLAGTEYFRSRAHLQKRQPNFFGWLKPSGAFRAAKIRLCILFYKAGWYVCYFTPGAILLLGAIIILFRNGIETGLFVVLMLSGGILLLAGSFFAFVSTQRYFAAEFIFAVVPGIKAKEAVLASVKIMDGKCRAAAMFKLSFLPWSCLCLFIFPTAYVWPYYKQSCAFWLRFNCKV